MLRAHDDEVLDLQFSHDGTRLATCSRDLTTVIYDVTRVPAGASGRAADDPADRTADDEVTTARAT